MGRHIYVLAGALAAGCSGVEPAPAAAVAQPVPAGTRDPEAQAPAAREVQPYSVSFEGVGDIALGESEVRQAVDSCATTGIVFADDRPTPATGARHGRVLAVVGESGPVIATEGLAGRTCLVQAFSQLVGQGHPPGSALGIRIGESLKTARLMRRRRLFSPTAEDRGAFVVLWDEPTLLSLVLAGALRSCVQDTERVSQVRFSMKDFGVTLEDPGKIPLEGCLNAALATQRMDASMDELAEGGTIVLAPAVAAMKVAVIGAEPEVEDAFLQAARRCPRPETGTSLTFALENSKATFSKGVSDRKVFTEPTALARCIEKRVGVDGSGQAQLYYTMH